MRLQRGWCTIVTVAACYLEMDTWALRRFVPFYSRAINPDTRYTLRVVFRICQYAATPSREHQKTESDTRFLGYSVKKNENSIKSIHM